MATSSRHSLQTTSTYSAACSIWAVPPRLSIRPPGRFLPARASLWKTPGSGGSPSGPGEGKGPESSLPPTPAHSVHLPSRERRGPGPGQGRPWKGAPPPLLASRSLSYSLSLGASARPPHARGRTEGLREERGAGGEGPRPSPRRAGRGTGAVHAPTRTARPSGRAASRALHAGSEDSAGPSPSARRRGPRGPSPPHPGGRRGRPLPSPPPGRGRASSGDVKGRAVAAPPRALVKKKKKRGNET